MLPAMSLGVPMDQFLLILHWLRETSKCLILAHQIILSRLLPYECNNIKYPCSHEYQMIMAVVWKRINDTGKNWRHVYKVILSIYLSDTNFTFEYDFLLSCFNIAFIYIFIYSHTYICFERVSHFFVSCWIL